MARVQFDSEYWNKFIRLAKLKSVGGTQENRRKNRARNYKKSRRNYNSVASVSIGLYRSNI